MKTLPLLLIFTFPAGCAPLAEVPSLLPRAVEKQGDALPPAPPPVPVATIDAPLSAKIAFLLGELRAGDADFTRSERDGARTITAGRSAAEGSESWILAEQARSALIAAREKSASALSEIDSLMIAQVQAAAANPALGGVAELTSAHSQATDVVARQTERLEALTR